MEQRNNTKDIPRLVQYINVLDNKLSKALSGIPGKHNHFIKMATNCAIAKPIIPADVPIKAQVNQVSLEDCFSKFLLLKYKKSVMMPAFIPPRSFAKNTTFLNSSSYSCNNSSLSLSESSFSLINHPLPSITPAPDRRQNCLYKKEHLFYSINFKRRMAI